MLLSPILSFADGGMFIYDPLAGRFDTHKEINQTAYINYENGFQKMILSIGVDGGLKRDALWIFPIPASPEKVVIDIITDVPSLSGEEIFNGASKRIRDAKDTTLMLANPLVWGAYKAMTSTFSMIPTTKVGMDFNSYPQMSGVTVFEHIEKEGMVSEIISAKDQISIYNYLTGKGLGVEKNSIPILGLYTEKDYSFVVSWIDSSYQQQATGRGVFVTFPTKQIYFPLIPTSVYGSEVVPAEIKIIEHMTPDIFENIKNYVKVSYYTEGRYLGPTDFYENKSGNNLNYTKIELNPPSKYLTEDLWTNNKAPINTILPNFIVNNYYVFFFFSFVFLSVLSSILAGIIVSSRFRSRKGFLKLGLIGLANCFTVYIYSIILFLYGDTSTETKEDKEMLEEIKDSSFVKRRRKIFRNMKIITAVLFLNPLIFVISEIFYFSYFYNSDFVVIFFWGSLIAFLVSSIFYVFKKPVILPEDGYVIEKLKMYGYSLKNLKKNDSLSVFRKIAIVILFSIIFSFSTIFIFTSLGKYFSRPELLGNSGGLLVPRIF